MPRNNSKKRQDERRGKANIRQSMAVMRTCGHAHTDNGAPHCKDKR